MNVKIRYRHSLVLYFTERLSRRVCGRLPHNQLPLFFISGTVKRNFHSQNLWMIDILCSKNMTEMTNMIRCNVSGSTRKRRVNAVALLAVQVVLGQTLVELAALALVLPCYFFPFQL